MIYFIRSGQYIKVGVAVNPWLRIADLQTGNPEPLEVLAIGPGDRGFESELHGLFGEHRGIGEWFTDNERIDAVIRFMRETFPELQERPECIQEEAPDEDITIFQRRSGARIRPETKRDKIERVLVDDPYSSYTEIAASVGVSRQFVGQVAQRLNGSKP